MRFGFVAFLRECEEAEGANDVAMMCEVRERERCSDEVVLSFACTKYLFLPFRLELSRCRKQRISTSSNVCNEKTDSGDNRRYAE